MLGKRKPSDQQKPNALQLKQAENAVLRLLTKSRKSKIMNTKKQLQQASSEETKIKKEKLEKELERLKKISTQDILSYKLAKSFETEEEKLMNRIFNSAQIQEAFNKYRELVVENSKNDTNSAPVTKMQKTQIYQQLKDKINAKESSEGEEEEENEESMGSFDSSEYAKHIAVIIYLLKKFQFKLNFAKIIIFSKKRENNQGKGLKLMYHLEMRMRVENHQEAV